MRDIYEELNKESIRLNKIYAEEFLTKDGIGLFTGVSGRMLNLGNLYLITNDDFYLEHLNKYLEWSIEFIESKQVDNPSFSGGLAGWAWLINYLYKKDLIEIEIEEFLLNIDLELEASMDKYIEIQQLDQINGALGIGRYFLSRGKRKPVEKLIHALDTTKIEVDDEIMWRVKRWQDDCLEYNFGLAHGIVGVIYFLTKSLSLGFETEICTRLLKGSVNFYMNNFQNFESVKSCFPYSILVTNYRSGKNQHSNTRLAWCYGDLGILYALLVYSISVDDCNVKKRAIDGLLLNSKRRTFKDVVIYDAGFCHGSAGLAYIYYKAWKLTGIENFRDTSEYWVKITIDFSLGSSTEKGYKFLIRDSETRQLEESDSLLEGTPGIQLIYNSLLHPNFSDWDEIFLLS